MDILTFREHNVSWEIDVSCSPNTLRKRRHKSFHKKVYLFHTPVKAFVPFFLRVKVFMKKKMN